MAEIIDTILPVDTGPDEYETIADWITGEAHDLTGGGDVYVAEFNTFSGGLDEDSALSGWTTDVDEFIILRAAPGHEPDFSARKQGFYFAPTSGNACIRPVSAIPYVELTDLEFDCTATGPTQQAPFSSSNGGGIESILTRITIDGVGNGDGIVFNAAGDNQIVEQLLVIDANDDGVLNGNGSVTFNHVCTVDALGRGFVHAGGNDSNLTNAFMSGSGGDDFSRQAGSLRSYIACSDTTAEGTGAIDSAGTDNFVNYVASTGDFRIAIDAADGLDDQGDTGTYMGCDLEVAAGGGRIMSSLVGEGGLAGIGGIAGPGGGLAG